MVLFKFLKSIENTFDFQTTAGLPIEFLYNFKLFFLFCSFLLFNKLKTNLKSFEQFFWIFLFYDYWKLRKIWSLSVFELFRFLFFHINWITSKKTELVEWCILLKPFLSWIESGLQYLIILFQCLSLIIQVKPRKFTITPEKLVFGSSFSTFFRTK